jgi:hypothetical protein
MEVQTLGYAERAGAYVIFFPEEKRMMLINKESFLISPGTVPNLSEENDPKYRYERWGYVSWWRVDDGIDAWYDNTGKCVSRRQG